MSVYTFKCQKCGKKFEVIASLKEKEEGKAKKFGCPECGCVETKPVFSLKTFFGKDKEGGGCCGTGDSGCSDDDCGSDDSCCSDDDCCSGGGCK